MPRRFLAWLPRSFLEPGILFEGSFVCRIIRIWERLLTFKTRAMRLIGLIQGDG
jgi:hypothetical protein